MKNEIRSMRDCYNVEATREDSKIVLEFRGQNTSDKNVIFKVRFDWWMIIHLLGALKNAWMIERESRVKQISTINEAFKGAE